MRAAPRILFLCLGFIVLAVPGGATEPLAVLSAGTARIDWAPQISAELFTLRVAAPDGAVYQQEFGAGTTPSFDLVREGKALPDGSYAWELRARPVIGLDIRRQLDEARRAGGDRTEALLRELRAAGKLPAGPLVQSGNFLVQGGVAVVNSGPEPRQPKRRVAAEASGPITPKDFVVPDDLIVQGSACFGFDCFNGMLFPFLEQILLSDLNTRIRFEDTSVPGGGFPTTDWMITVNDVSSGDRFSIEDLSSATVPVSIQGGAPTNSLVADLFGDVGTGTFVPFRDFEIVRSDTPSIGLVQDGSVFPAQIWDILGNELAFSLFDANRGLFPFQVIPGAPTNSLFVSALGRVGLGTSNPGGQLHIFGGAGNDVFAGMGPDLVNGPGFNFGYAGASFGRGAGFFNVRPDGSAVAPNPSLRFATANVTRLVIDNEGFAGFGVVNPAFPIHMASGAVVTVGGVWTNASSRDLKQDIAALTPEEARHALDGLEPVRYAYKADPAEHHVGFIAEDAPDLLATADRKGMSPMDVVAVLTKVVQEQQRTIDALAAEVEELKRQKD